MTNKWSKAIYKGNVIACIFNDLKKVFFTRAVFQETSTLLVLTVKKKTVHYSQWLQLRTEIL